MIREPAQPIVLYHHWRSSSSWRVRWALIEKGIPFVPAAVDLLAGEQSSQRTWRAIRWAWCRCWPSTACC